MIKFFRKIRQRLLSENKFSKYLIYAFGEIILVVIGILLALQINNWNQERTQQKAVKTALEQIQNELLNDLTQSYNLTAYLERKDSIIERVLKDEVTENDYKTYGNLRYLIRNTRVFTLNRDGYTSLMNIIDESKFSNPELLSALKNLYVDRNKNHERVNGWFSDFVHEYNNELTNNYLWHSSTDALIDSLTQSEIDYLLYDPLYKNKVARYRNLGIGNLNNDNYGLQVVMAHLYNSISEVTEKGIDNNIIASYFKSPTDSISAPFLGTYTYDGDESFKLFQEQDSLKIQIFPSDQVFHLVGGQRNRFQIYNSSFQFVIVNDSTLRDVSTWRVRYNKVKDN
ncbi:MAG: hypothetical protein ED556_01990 [Winogradskyella sp.]|uniref:DUF6090 family protein n=1 Tax=Winogradskyella sp. TaxID=1883156 RepID=UPI000F412E55|nr:DUF6090 family protein [Winogradskyella sp.]RNC87983.1 MAG: hypothetical protein ED556_01990 [Winogradskyella sp.]